MKQLSNSSSEKERIRLIQSIERGGFWFIDIPRTASSSIRYHLAAKHGYPHGKKAFKELNHDISHLASEMIASHTPAYIAKDIITAEIWSKIQVFTVIRHPISWAVSLWRYTHTFTSLGFAKTDFHQFLLQLECFLDTAPESNWRPGPNRCLQSDYIFCPRSGLRLVPHVFRFEDPINVWKWLAEELDIQVDKPLRLWETKSEQYQPNDTDKALAKKILARDFQLLGYELEN